MWSIKNQYYANEVNYFIGKKITDKQIQYTEFLCFLMNKNEDCEDIQIMEDNDYENVVVFEPYEIYDVLETDIFEFKDNFVSAKYIDKLEEQMDIVIRVNGIEKKYRVEVM
ncbi:hypothetical protein [Clostridium sp. ZBS18]|uniref:hypothetical protein n=1 Tax=Clostridium sp. ZBS18 TaxID=2949967 RepID=UPI002079F541|nr:hypothetical protein [Clostridium sp. ZBS18]